MATPAGGYDRAAILRDAHKRYRDGKRLGLGWSWSQCLSTAWAAAKQRRALAEDAKKRQGQRNDLKPQNIRADLRKSSDRSNRSDEQAAKVVAT
ncbi:hypothetical protein [Methylocystis sp. ATCC 49242]|uniref:hypothetical protein n=1 Tax=Methylocystis sp. ATCC 49242 TaxID=622637 RepID=UPI0001F8785E|nr:hypothetical protein [Methylocystis sp. ATCC 49242]